MKKKSMITARNLFSFALFIALVGLFQLSAAATMALGGAYREAVQLALAYAGLTGFVLVIAVTWRRFTGLPRALG